MHAANLIDFSLLRWIPLLPALGFVFCAFAAQAGKRHLAMAVAPLLVLGSFVIALVAVAKLAGAPAGTAVVDHVFEWIHAGPLALDVGFRVDALTAVMVLIVTGVGFLIHVYSRGYMHDDPDAARFFAYLNLFTFSMLTLVLGDSVVLLFVGWEGVGLCSYLLIGFWYADMANCDAGRKAFIANRIGDAGFLIGTFLLFWATVQLGAPTLDFVQLNGLAPKLATAAPGLVTAACLFLFLGATGKSAQIPLYVWLPDAMAGPTPVSALIHAATMVTAGIYMISRLSPVFVHAPAALEVIAVVGALTAFFAATVGMVQNDIKKVLAYSTVSQLGYMFLALGSGAFAVGIFHVMTHAFFKALLFLCSGSVIHAMSGEQDMRHMGGLRKKLPITSATMLVGTLAISGAPGFSGFFSKDEILLSAWEAGHKGLWFLGVVTAGLTAFYMFRLYFMTFTGESRVDHEREHHLHESPASMTGPLVILAVLATIGGYVGLPHGWLWGFWFGDFLAPVLGTVSHDIAEVSHGHAGGAPEGLLMLFTTAVAAAGFFAAWFLYVRSPELPGRIAERLGGFYGLVLDKYRIDELYDTLVIRPVVSLSGILWKVVDAGVIDGVVNGTGNFVEENSGMWRKLQSGNFQHYALAMLIGAVGIAGFYWLAR